MFLRTRPGEGCQELRPPVCQKRFGRPDLDAYRSRFEPLSYLLGPWAVKCSFVSFKGIEGGFEELWRAWLRMAEESVILRRHDQGCVEVKRGLEDPKLPLSAPTGVHLAPTSQELVEGLFCELLRVVRVLGRSLWSRSYAAGYLMLYQRSDALRTYISAKLAPNSQKYCAKQ